MREILYRGKRKDNGEWIKGDFCSPCNIVFLENGYDAVLGKDDCPMCNDFEVIPETVGQYTGLTDKNGKKIFEGDIVKADDYIFAVKFGKCGGVANAENYGYMGFYFEAFSESTKLSAKYGLRDDICYFTDVEVIGNIHDNPELLKGGAE